MEEEGKTIIHNHYSPGANCQVFNSPVTGCVFAMPGAQVTQQLPPTSTDKEETPEATLDEKDEAIVEELAPIFFGIKDDAREFLKMIKVMKPVQMPRAAKKWMDEKRISENSLRRDLWSVLHKNNIYPRLESTWNDTIRKL